MSCSYFSKIAISPYPCRCIIRQRSEDKYLYQFDLKNDFLQYFSLQDHPCPHFQEDFFIIQPLLADLGLSLVDRAGHYSSACLIRHPLKSFVSYGNQDNTVQEFSPHKCSQGIWWDTLNVVAATIPLVTLGLTPSLKHFLYSVASSSNVLLTWPWLASPALPSKGMVSSELHQPPQPQV